MNDFDGFADRFQDRASGWDTAQTMPVEVRAEIAAAGYLGAAVPAAYGGGEYSARRLGELCLSLGRVCTSLRSLVTVQAMVVEAIRRWGTPEQRGRWLPRMARGEVLAGLAATEPEAGSDLAATRTTVTATEGGHRVTGIKTWVTFGEIADVYLVLGAIDERSVAILVERTAPGVTVRPVRDQLGLRAAMVADLKMDRAVVGPDAMIGPPGFGLSHVVLGALDHGRHTVAWGAAGMVQSCLELSARHATARWLGDAPLADRQLIRRLVTDMAVDAHSTRLLCQDAAERLSSGAPHGSTTVMTVKYAAARAAAAAAEAAVQVCGSAGCAAEHPAQRFFRDSKILQLIEGSDQIGQLTICDVAFRRYRAVAR